MKIVILGGFLGSGKTTVLLRLAAYAVGNHEGSGVPVAIIENEIGDVSVDTKLLGGYEVRELFSGCICCTLAGDLTSCSEEIRKQYDPEWLLIEATGMAKPSAVKQVMSTYSGAESLRTVVLADASRWDDLFDYMEVFMTSQLKGADVILLNKCDLVSPEDLERIRSDIEELAPGTRVEAVCAREDGGEWIRGILG